MRKLFVLGDSISIHYGPDLEKMLQGVMEYSRKVALTAGVQEDMNRPLTETMNGGDSSMALQYLQRQLRRGKPEADLILLNCGLHDIRTNTETGARQVPLEQYKANLRQVVELLKDHGKQIVWVRTTPVNDGIHNAVGATIYRYEADVAQYNDAADKIMEKYGIISIDLHTFTKSLGDQVYCDRVHFTDQVRALQAAFIAGRIYAFASRPRTTARC